MKWKITQLNVNNSISNETLSKEVYMQQPLGFLSSDPKLICKLHKAIYGLKQAPRAWFEKLTSTLHSFGFVTSKCDSFSFTLTSSTYTSLC